MRKGITVFVLLLVSCVAIGSNDVFIDTNEVVIYPIPAKKHFTVKVPSDYRGGKIIITNVVGKEVLLIQIQNEEKIKILTNEFSKGIYFVSIQVNTGIIFTKRIIIDK